MPSAPLPPEKQAEINELARAIREAVDAELNELATTDDAHLFGDNEFKIRPLAPKIAAKAAAKKVSGTVGCVTMVPGTFFSPRRCRARGREIRGTTGPDLMAGGGRWAGNPGCSAGQAE